MVTESSTYSAVQKRLNGARSSWRNRIVFFDADTALSQFMLPGGFDSNRAAKYLGQMIRDARATARGPIRFYGEMGNLLCRRKEFSAALQLEGLAGLVFSADPQASILCGYSSDYFETELGAAHLLKVFATHDEIIPAENFVAVRRGERFDKARQQCQAALDQPSNADADRFDGSLQLSEKPTVYIIDDDPSVRRALTRLLAAKGMEVRAFESAETFLAELDKLPRGSMIVDIQLVGMDGLELLGKMARAGKRWPAVVVSGSLVGHEALLRALSSPGQLDRDI
jgi:CheY-like chemotaxis protein